MNTDKINYIEKDKINDIHVLKFHFENKEILINQFETKEECDLIFKTIQYSVGC